MHIIPNDQRTLPADDPCHLNFNMTMQMWIEVRQFVFFDMKATADLFRNGKLNDFHTEGWTLVGILQVRTTIR